MSENIHGFPKHELKKKKLRVNDSYGKNKQRIITHRLKPQNYGLNINNEDDLPLQSYKPLKTEMTLKERENPLKKYERNNNIKRISFTTPKYHLLESKTPIRDNVRKNIYTKLISSRLNNNTFYKTTNAFNDLYDPEIKDKYNIIHNKRPSLRLKYRYNSRQNFHRVKTEFDLNNENTYEKNNININRTNYIRDNIKLKELISMNNSLNNQNSKLKLQVRELTYKLKEIKENNVKLMKDNQYITTMNKKLKLSLNDKQKEIKNIKDMSSTEIDSQNNKITKLIEQLNQMNNSLEEKNIIISQLTNNNNNPNYNANNDLGKYADEINGLINQVNEMKKDKQNFLIEKQKNEQVFNQKLNLLNQKINTLTQENKKYLNIINNLKGEKAQDQNKNAFNIYNNDNEELQNKINELENQNNQLKEEMIKKDKNIFDLIEEKNNLIDQNRELTDLLKLHTNESKLTSLLGSQMNSGEQNINKENQIKSLIESNNKFQKENSNLLNKISILEKEKQNIIDNVNKTNLNIQQNQDLSKQITTLKKENEKLKNQLINYMNSETNNNNKIKEILHEKSELLKENSELKNDMKELENENHKNVLQLSKLSQLQKELDNLKKENETIFAELKLKQEENQKLYNIVKDKERENENLKNQIEKKNELEGEKEDYDVEMFNVEMNNEIKEKNVLIDRLQKQIKILENENKKITDEKFELKEKLQLIQGGKDEDHINNIVNLNDELKDKNMQLQKLINENKILRNKTKEINSSNNINNFSNNEEEKEIDLNNNNNLERNPFRITMNSQGLSEADKIKLYKERIKELEMTNESDKIQIKTLKDDIKLMKDKIKNLETFGGQIKDINEFIYLLNLSLISYKPKKQEQKDALNKIINILNNFQGINLNQ